MSDHDFEKRVQQKMDELKLRPSAAVWTQVERNIHREKRRRRAIFWLPLACLLLATGGYFIFSGSTKDDGSAVTAHSTSTAGKKNIISPDNTGNNKVNKPEKGSTVNKNSDINQNENNISGSNSIENHILPDNNTARKQSIGNNNKTVDQPVTGQPTIVTDKDMPVYSKLPKEPQAEKTASRQLTAGEQNKPIQKKPVDQQAKNASRQGSDIPSPEVQKTIVQHDVDLRPNSHNQPDKNVSDKDSSNQQNTTDKKTADVVKADPVTNITGSITVDSITRDTAVMVSPVTKDSPLVAARQKIKPVSGWQWGIKAAAGIANFSAGNLFDFSGSTRVEDLAAFPSYNQSPAPPREPSPITAGTAFSIGGFVQRPVSKRLTLSAGLQYSYFSVHTTVGQRVDSLQTINVGTFNSRFTNQYYRGNNTQPYTFRYHFIELPVQVNIRLNNSKRIPLSWDAGIAVSRLAGTNALHYDGISGVYYQNNDFFIKTQYRVSTGFEVGLLQQSKFPIWVGPDIRYFISDLIDEEVSSGQQLWSAGIQMKMLLKK